MAHAPQGITLRSARVDDAPTILALYAPYVKDTAITFETEAPSLEAFRQRMAAVMEHYPYLVAEDDGTVVGYAYAHRIGERAAYAWNAELSVYLDPARKGNGLGRMLCTAMLDLLTEQGIRNVFSLITVPNEASIGLHEALGFTLMGIQQQAGFKCGAWHDVAWFQKRIGAFSGTPDSVTPLADLDRAVVARVLERAATPTGRPRADR